MEYTESEEEFLNTPQVDEEKYPVHFVQENPRLWYACSEPERPWDHECLWDDRCTACMIALQALVMRGDSPLLRSGTAYGAQFHSGPELVLERARRLGVIF